MKNKIYGIEKVLMKQSKIEYNGKEYSIKEMNLKQYLSFLDGHYNADELEKVLALVNECCNVTLELEKLVDDDYYLIYFLFNAVIDLQMSKDEVEESDYNYQIDYSYSVVKVMRYFNYKLEELYDMPHSIFMNILNHLKILECEEDMRKMSINTAIESRKIKESNVYSKFVSRLSKSIERVVKIKMTEKANLSKWRQYIGTDAIKKRLDESEVE